MTYGKPIVIQELDQEANQWNDILHGHAAVNKQSGSEYLSSGADQSKQTMVFTLRYNSIVKGIRLNTQMYRIIYDGDLYDVQDYDDYLERHQTVKLLGVARCGS